MLCCNPAEQQAAASSPAYEFTRFCCQAVTGSCSDLFLCDFDIQGRSMVQLSLLSICRNTANVKWVCV